MNNNFLKHSTICLSHKIITLIFIVTFFSFGNLYVKAAVDTIAVKKNKIELQFRLPYHYLFIENYHHGFERPTDKVHYLIGYYAKENGFYQDFGAGIFYSRKINYNWSLCGEVEQNANSIIRGIFDSNTRSLIKTEKTLFYSTTMSALIKRNLGKGININFGPSFLYIFPSFNKKYKEITSSKSNWRSLWFLNLGAGFEHTFNNNMTFSINPNVIWFKGDMRNLFNDLIDKSSGANNEVRAYFRFDVSLGVGYSF